jgi:hypothetical protein
MSAPAYLVTNLAAAGTLSASTEDTDWPLANLVDTILAKPFKFIVTTGGYIEADLGSTQSFNTVALLGHNLLAVGSGTVKAGASANPSTTVGTLVYRASDLWCNVGAQSARYVRVTFTDTNTENSFIGELVIGQRVALPRAAKWGIEPSREEMDIVNSTIRGVDYVNKLFGRERFMVTFRFPESERASFKALHTAVGGKLLPFLWLPNPATSADCYYMRKESDFKPAIAGTGMDGASIALWYDYTLELMEESHGAFVLV